MTQGVRKEMGRKQARQQVVRKTTQKDVLLLISDGPLSQFSPHEHQSHTVLCQYFVMIIASASHLRAASIILQGEP